MKINKKIQTDIRKVQETIIEIFNELRNGKKTYIMDIKKYKEHVIDTLSRMVNKKIIGEGCVDSCGMLWNTWTFWQKIVWVIKNKFSLGKKEKAQYDKKYNDLSQWLYKKKYDIDEIYELEKLFEEKYKKYWYEPDPKSIIVLDYSFRPIFPIEYTSVKYTVKLDEN